MPPGEAPALLRATAGRWIGELAGADVAQPDADVEAGHLGERAAEFRRLGRWAEAVAMIEASLLLKPGRRELHESAALALDELAAAQYDPYGDLENFARKARLGLAYCRRGIEHVESALTTAPVTKDFKEYQRQAAVAAACGVRRGYTDRYARDHDVTEVVKLCDEAHLLREQAQRRIIEAQLAAGRADPLITDMLVHHAVRPGETDYPRRLWAIRAMRGAAHPEMAIRRVAADGIPPSERATGGYRAFLEQVEALDWPAARKAVAAVRAGDAKPATRSRRGGRRRPRPGRGRPPRTSRHPRRRTGRQRSASRRGNSPWWTRTGRPSHRPRGCRGGPGPAVAPTPRGS